VKTDQNRRYRISEAFPHIEEAFFRGDNPALVDPFVLTSSNLDVEARRRAFKIGVIGTRRPSHYGFEVVQKLLLSLAQFRDWIWVSGGAFGVDAELHRVALEYELLTQAWLVGPIDEPSPRSHSWLFSQMKKRPGCGILVPESLDPSSGHRARPSSWLERNRWLAADVDALVVVEAHEKSGTWNTTTQALEFGKEVFLIPGPIFNESSRGTNSMIASGYGHGVVSLADLTKSLVVLSLERSYNYK
jgi:DNA processing protein